MKKKGNISIKAKLLGIIIPVVIAIILILVFTAYHVSSGIIESYSKNLLESSVNNQKLRHGLRKIWLPCRWQRP